MERRTDNELTMPAVATHWGVCTAVLRRLIERDDFRALRVGRQYHLPARPFERCWPERLDAGLGQ
jgi:hypothetical protein